MRDTIAGVNNKFARKSHADKYKTYFAYDKIQKLERNRN